MRTITIRKHWRWVATLYLLFLACLATVTGMRVWYNAQLPPLATAFPTGTLTVAVDPTYPPFAVDSGNGYEGIDIDLANELAARMGVEVQFVGMSFDALYDAVTDGRVDAVISALLVNPARTQEVHYTRPYFDNGLVLVNTQADDTIVRMRDLPGYALAFEYGSLAHSEVNRWSQQLASFGLRPYELPSYALDAVRLNASADAALVDTTTFLAYQQVYPTWQPNVHRVSNAFYAIGVSRERNAAWRWLDATLRDIENDGTLAHIIETNFDRMQNE